MKLRQILFFHLTNPVQRHAVNLLNCCEMRLTIIQEKRIYLIQNFFALFTPLCGYQLFSEVLQFPLGLCTFHLTRNNFLLHLEFLRSCFQQYTLQLLKLGSLSFAFFCHKNHSQIRQGSPTEQTRPSMYLLTPFQSCFGCISVG